MEMESNRKFNKPVPPELLAEMHKCLPMDNAFNVFVNVPCKAIVINNRYRMHRQLQRLKTSLREYIRTLTVDHQRAGQVENGEDEFVGTRAEKRYKSIAINSVIPWVPELDALLRYGAWVTPTRFFFMRPSGYLLGIPEYIVEDLIVHLANSSLAERTLEFAQLRHGQIELPWSLEQLIEKKKLYANSGRIFIESDVVKIGDKIVHIRDGDLANDNILTLHLENKENPTKWFEVRLDGVGESIDRINRMEFTAIQPTIEHIQNECQWSGHPLILQKASIHWTLQMDSFLRRGADFTHYRHFQITEGNKITNCPLYYAEELICYMAYTKNPHHVLKSLDIKIQQFISSGMLHQIWQACREGVPEDGRLMKSDNENLLLLAGIAHDPILILTDDDDEQLEMPLYRVEFTLANWPTNFAYFFDIDVLFPDEKILLENNKKKIIEIAISRRQKNDMTKLGCHQIGQGTKRKAANANDGEPKCYDEEREHNKRAKYNFR